MTFRPLVLLALAVLVPVLCLDLRKQRCELRDQLRNFKFPKGIWDYKVARVICEVEKFVNQSMMGPPVSPVTSAPSNSSMPSLNSSFPSTPAPPAPGSQSSSEEDSSEEHSGREGVGKDLRQCVAVTNSTSVKVDADCLRKAKVFLKVYLNAGEECKNIDPKDFFQGCSNSSPSNHNSSSEESEEKSDSEEQPKSKPQSKKKGKPGKNKHH